MDYEKKTLGPTWNEIEAARMEREDRAVRNRIAEYERRHSSGYVLMDEDLDYEN